MRRNLARKIPILALAIGLLVSLTPSISSSAQKITPGAACKSVNSKVTFKNKVYTCQKKGKKLVWSKGVTVKSASSNTNPTPAPSPTPQPTSTQPTTPENLSSQVCTKENEVVRNSVGEFWCLKSPDGQLRWSQNNISNQPTPTSSPTPLPTSTAKTKSEDEIHGQSCTKENERIRNSINEFRCLRVPTGELRWNEVYRFRNPIPRPSLPPINYVVNQYAPPKMPSAPIQNCKIQENSDQGAKRGDLASGFPFMPRFESYPKTIKMALVPIDFSDLVGEKDFRPRVNSQMQMMSDWFKDVSGGRLTVEWVVSENWIRLPGVSNDYFVEFSGAYPDTENFWKKVLPVVDSNFDLSGVQTVNFILPFNQKIIYESVQSFSFLSEMKKYNSSKTKLFSFALAGEVFEAVHNPYWSYWAHEFGHEIGLAHVGSSRGEVEPMNGLDLMGNQGGPYRELSGWLRFIIGWLDDSQVYCQETNGLTSNEISLVPLSDNKNGIKLVVIPTSSESAIVIDSRRPTKYSCDIPNMPGGVLVYTYDAKLSNQAYFLKAYFPADRQPTIRCEAGVTIPDVFLHTGDSVQVGAYKITVTSSGTFDQITITKN